MGKWALNVPNGQAMSESFYCFLFSSIKIGLWYNAIRHSVKGKWKSSTEH